MSETVSANITLKLRRSKDSNQPAVMTNTAKNLFQKLGFQIAYDSKSFLTIKGEKELFEKVFDTKLEKKRVDIQARKPDGNYIFFEIKKPITIPKQLTNLIERLTLPVPPTLFQENSTSDPTFS